MNPQCTSNKVLLKFLNIMVLDIMCAALFRSKGKWALYDMEPLVIEALDVVDFVSYMNKVIV